MATKASISIVVGALLVGSLASCGGSDTQVVSVGEPIEPDPMLVEVVETESEEVPIITPEPLPTPEPVPEPQPVEIEEENEVSYLSRFSPQWSPDGKYIAYISESSEDSIPGAACFWELNYHYWFDSVMSAKENLKENEDCIVNGHLDEQTIEINVMNIDNPPGFGITGPLYSEPFYSGFTISDLQWSPDGKRFAYTEYCDWCTGSMGWHTAVRIFTPAQWHEGEPDPDGNSQDIFHEREFAYPELKSNCDSGCFYESARPLWTGDGQHLVFTIGNRDYWRYGGGLLNIVDADGSNTRLLPAPSNPIAGAASPDGQYIAGSSAEGMFVVNIDGSDLRIFENDDDNVISDIPYTWSVDGTKILFSRITQPEDETQDSERTVMIMNVDGSEMRQITEEEFFMYQTLISPDRSTIVYADEVNGFSEIFLVDADGENRRQLTFSAK